MKKLICIILILCLPVIAVAETDLTSMSYDALVNLQRSLTTEIMSRPEWKSVTVPAGTWLIGTDIPAGSYSLSSKRAGVVVWRRAIDDYSDNGLYYNEIIREDEPCGKIILTKGMVLVNSGEVVFSPPLSLGF